MARESTEECWSNRARYRTAGVPCVAQDRPVVHPQLSVTPYGRNPAVFSNWRRCLCVLAALLSLTLSTWAQNENDVHVTPRAKPAADTPKPGGADSALKTHTRAIKVDVDLVLVPATVTDPMNRLVTGLDKVNFQLFEGNSAQEIRTFSAEDAPVSLG